MQLDGIDPSRIPVHVACVMDGNGRWASKRGLPRTEGHAAGEQALFDTVEGALELGIRWLTVYAFSTENCRRPADEVRYLMGFNESILVRRRDELNERGVHAAGGSEVQKPRLARAGIQDVWSKGLPARGAVVPRRVSDILRGEGAANRTEATSRKPIRAAANERPGKEVGSPRRGMDRR